ncbi:MAG: cyanophycin synthetase [Burkholderiaceae bacterium]
MKLTRIRALRGPNLWSRRTVIETIVTGLEDESTARALESQALRLQQQAGCPVSFSLTAPTREAGVWRVVVEYSEEAVGRLAVALAARACKAIDPGCEAGTAETFADPAEPFDLPAAVAQLRELDEAQRLGPSTGAIVDAALNRGIPFRRLTEGSLVQFGWGHRQRRIQAAEIDRTSAVAEAVAQDKELTKTLLHAAGIPVPPGHSVDSADAAWEVARLIGEPVVVKPRHGNQGKGVAVGVSGREQIRAAFDAASEHGSEVLVEKLLPGQDFRLLVVGDRMVAAARRDPPQVIGDGASTVRQLVDLLNTDPRRGDGHATALTRIRLDEIALARLAAQGHSPDTVPERGERVVLRNNANLSTGGSATDVTDEVHPELAARAVVAAQTVGLDICGVDVVCTTVREPLEAQDGGIVEVNAAPGLRMHLSPSFGRGQPVGEAIIDTLFDTGDDGRIPLIAVTGNNGKTTTVRLLAHMARLAGHQVGMTNSDGVHVADRRIDTGDCSGPRSARKVLAHPDVDFAVLETARGGILREGLGFDRCQVAVVTNLGSGDHLGLDHIHTVDELAAVKRVIVENVAASGSAVLNAADPIVAAMAGHCPASVIFFATDPQQPVLAAHCAGGGRVVQVEDGGLVARDGLTRHRIELDDIPLTGGGTIPFQVENALAAMAAGWAAGLPWEAIEAGLRSFVSDPGSAPGRFNRFDYRGATIIADYGHNPDAIAALVRAVDALPAQRRLVVISAAGDRRDEDIRRQAELLGDAFDAVLLYEDACQRGRADGEVCALLRSGFGKARRVTDIDEVHGELAAIDRALAGLQPGDLCLILIDQVEAALAHLAQRMAEPLPRAA